MLDAALRRLSYARKVSGAIGRRVTGGVGAGAGSLARAFGARVPCLRNEPAASAEIAGSSRNAIDNAASFFM
jgi:hypothetical protein